MGSISEQNDAHLSTDGTSKHITTSEHSNTEGTEHQAALGPQPQRKHFFSALNSAYAEAVNLDAEKVEYKPEEEVNILSQHSLCLTNILNLIYRELYEEKSTMSCSR